MFLSRLFLFFFFFFFLFLALISTSKNNFGIDPASDNASSAVVLLYGKFAVNGLIYEVLVTESGKDMLSAC